MHEAFTYGAIVQLPKVGINAIHAYSNKLLLIDAQNCLTHYAVDGDLKALHTIKAFCKSKPIKIYAVKETGMLLVLVDSYLCIYSLNTLTLQQKLTTTKGAVSFNVWSGVDHSSGIPVLSTQVLVCVKRQVLLFTWLDSEFDGEQHFDCPDRTREAEFLTDKLIVVGLTNDFVTIDIDSGAVEALPLSLSSFGAVSTTMGYLGSRAPKPLLTRTKDQMLLVRDVQSSFIDHEMNVLDTKSVNWQTAPELVGYTYPYLVDVLKTKVEIRFARTGTLIQSFDIANVTLLCDGKCLTVATAHTVYKFSAVPYAEQIEQLLETKQFSEALQLLEVLDSVLLEDKTGLIRRTKELQAHFLFEKGDYDTSMDSFSESWCLPSNVIDLLASIETIDAGEIDEEKTRSSIDESQKVTETVVDVSEAGREAARSVSAYLARSRRLLTRFITTAPGAEAADQYFTSWPDSRPASKQELEAELGLTDTALLKIYIRISPGLVGSLVRLPNRCDPEVVKDYLVKEDRWRELVDFFYSKMLHRDALELMQEKDAVVMAIQYIQRLDARSWQLIKDFLPWLFNHDEGSAAMDIFTETSAEAETYDRTEVAATLTQIDAKFGLEYLEYLMNECGEAASHFSEDLITLYIQTERLPQLKNFLTAPTNKASIFQVYARIPQDEQFYEIRAISLALMQNIQKALEIFVYKIKVPARSEEFALAQSSSFPSALEILLNLYLSPPNDEPIMTNEAISLLSRHGPRLPIQLTLSSLPPTVHIPRMEQYLTTSIRTTLSNNNSCLIQSKLQEQVLLTTQLKVVAQRTRSVFVTEDRVCPVCHKRLGTSTVAVRPDDGVIHYRCQR